MGEWIEEGVLGGTHNDVYVPWSFSMEKDVLQIEVEWWKMERLFEISLVPWKEMGTHDRDGPGLALFNGLVEVLVGENGNEGGT